MAVDPHARFVILCTREPEEAPSSAVRRAAEQVSDWTAVVETAARHRVATFVEEACTRGAVSLPAIARDQLGATTLRTVAHTLMLDAELTRLTSALAAREIPVIVLKGPVLARTIYRCLSARPYSDLDLVVHVEQEDAAIATVTRLGYREVPHEAEEARRAHASTLACGAAFHRQFVNERNGALVEVHLDPLQLGIQPVCEAERWQRALPIPGLPGALMLAPEDQLVQLAVHAHKHGFERLIWIKDLDLLIRAYRSTLDHDLVVRVARREGVAASLWLAIRLARSLLRTPGTAALEARLRPSPVLGVLYGLVWPAHRIHNLSGHMRRRAVQFHAAESLRGMVPSLVLFGRRRDRARAILSHLLPLGPHSQPLSSVRERGWG